MPVPQRQAPVPQHQPVSQQPDVQPQEVLSIHPPMWVAGTSRRVESYDSSVTDSMPLCVEGSVRF